MTTHRTQTQPRRPPSAIAGSIAAILAATLTLLAGCQSSPNGGMAFPWQNNNPLASLPQPSANNPNNWTPPSSNNNPLTELQSLMSRQDAQARLAEDQRQALAQLSEYQQSQNEQLAALANQRRQQELGGLEKQAELLRAQQAELEGLAELRRRTLELDANNRDLHAQLAQLQQENRLFEDQTRLLKQQLSDTVARLSESQQSQAVANRRMQELQTESQRQYQIAQEQAQQQIQLARQNAQQRVAELESSLQRRGGATIRANSSVQRNLTPVQIAGLQVRQDGDVIRVELPADVIFAPSSASLTGNAPSLIDQVAISLKQNYPRQIIGIEAHTDNGELTSNAWRSNHQLSAAQAMAVFEQLTQRHQFSVQQLFVLGHGANYPVASNGTPGGQQRNRRVEVVIYPETIDQR